MSNLNPFAISGILIVLTYAPFVLFILFNAKSNTAKLFLLHAICVTSWGIFCTLIALSNDPKLSELLWKLAYLPVIFIPIFFYHTVYSLINKTKFKNLLLLFFYIQGIFFIWATFNLSVINDIVWLFNSFYYIQGTILALIQFIIWLLIISITHFELIKFHKTGKREVKKFVYILILATPIGFLGGLTNFLPVFGINLYPYGNFLVSIYGFVSTYAIFKHQLLDIKIVIRKGLLYSSLITLISLSYLLIVIVGESLIQNYFEYQSLIIKTSAAFALGLLVLPLRRRIQVFIDKYFFRGTQEEIYLQNELLRKVITQTDKYKSLSTFSSGIAHEIKNPLTAIKTFSEFLPKKLEDKAFLKKFSRIVSKEVDRINDLINQLLDYGRPIPLTLRGTNIYKLLDDSLDILNSQFLDKRVNVIRIYPEKSELALKIDPNQIKQALLNILLNAVEAMPHGGELTVSTDLIDGRLHINIRDTGIGISKKDLSHIFDPFYSSKNMNTGLGLSITQTITEQHRGKITVKSQEGVGSEFTLQLPLG